MVTFGLQTSERRGRREGIRVQERRQDRQPGKALRGSEGLPSLPLSDPSRIRSSSLCCAPLPDFVPLPTLPSRGSQGSWRGDLASAHSSDLHTHTPRRHPPAPLFKLKFSPSLLPSISPSLPPPRLETPLLSAPPFPRTLHLPASRSVSSSSDALNSEAINS